MSAFQEAVAHDLDQNRIRFEGADHALTLRPSTAKRPLFCDRRTHLWIVARKPYDGLIFSVWTGIPTTPPCSTWTAC